MRGHLISKKCGYLRKLDHGFGTASAASAIVSGTWLLWLLRGPLGEGRELVEAALRDDVPMVAQMRSRLLYGAAAFSLAHGDLDQATAAGRECLAVSRNGTPPPILSVIATNDGWLRCGHASTSRTSRPPGSTGRR